MKKYKANGARIKALRADKDEDSMQKQVAHALGISERKLRKIENENDLITRKTADALAKLLNVPWQSLVYAAEGPQLVEAVSASHPPKVLPTEKFISIPRYDHHYAGVVRDEAKLYEEAWTNYVVIPHIQTALTSETSAYAEELLNILEKLAYHPRYQDKPTIDGREEITLRRRIRELLVLLRGNDVWVYTITHMKNLPESDEPLAQRSTEFEFQLVIAFGPPGEYGEETMKVPVDNGHPFSIPSEPVF